MLHIIRLPLAYLHKIFLTEIHIHTLSHGASFFLSFFLSLSLSLSLAWGLATPTLLKQQLALQLALKRRSESRHFLTSPSQIIWYVTYLLIKFSRRTFTTTSKCRPKCRSNTSSRAPSCRWSRSSASSATPCPFTSSTTRKSSWSGTLWRSCALSPRSTTCCSSPPSSSSPFQPCPEITTAAFSRTPSRTSTRPATPSWPAPSTWPSAWLSTGTSTSRTAAGRCAESKADTSRDQYYKQFFAITDNSIKYFYISSTYVLKIEPTKKWTLLPLSVEIGQSYSQV